MKTLIVYYTRTGTTKKFAESLAQELSADLEELKEDGNYAGAIGWLRAGKAGGSRKEVEIHETKYDPREYDLVVLGTPVWAGLCAPAIRAYIKKHKNDFTETAIFTTQGSDKRQRALDDMKEQLGVEPMSELHVSTKEVKQDQYIEKLRNFIK